MTGPDCTLAGWLARRVIQTPGNAAITFEGHTATYAELSERVARLANALRNGGVEHGDRVAYLSFNHPTFFETLFACARLGAIFVPLNFRLTAAELSFIITDSGVHTLLAGPDHQATLDSVREDVGVTRWIGVEHAGAGWEDYDELLSAGDPSEPPAPVDLEDTAVIMYTSGTTGHPKGAMLTHGNLWWNNVGSLHTYDYGTDEVTLVFAPLFHIGGLNVTTLIVLQKGGEVVLHRHFDPEAAVRAIEDHRVTTVFGVPAMFLVMSQLDAFDTADLTSLRFAICGGAPVPEPLIKRYAGVGVPFFQGYGLTETAPALTVLTKDRIESKLGSAGRPVFFTDMKLIADDGSTVDAPFVRGEICARGPNIMKGYWNRDAETRAVLDDGGWFRTGDVGYVDEEGFYFIVDRVKDMVITGGENVYPAEVEEVLLAHPVVTGVAVIGLPSARWGEQVTAVATLEPHAELTLEELRSFAGESLARYKLPSRLEIVDEIPHNASGKMLKRELRERFTESGAPA